jgi:zinc finger protein
LKVDDREDLSRDILKVTTSFVAWVEILQITTFLAQSETSGFSIPEIDLVLHPGTLGGRFTTLEGILEQVYEELSEKVFAGDSSNVGSEEYQTFETFLKGLKEVWMFSLLSYHIWTLRYGRIWPG